MSTTETQAGRATADGMESVRAGAAAAAKSDKSASSVRRTATFRVWRGDAAGGELRTTRRR